MLSLKELHFICRKVVDILKISEGEFWLWYGNPFMLSVPDHKNS